VSRFSDDGVWTCSGRSAHGFDGHGTCTEPGTALDAATTHRHRRHVSGDTNYTGFKRQSQINRWTDRPPHDGPFSRSPNPSSLGAPVTYTATVHGAAGSISNRDRSTCPSSTTARPPRCARALGPSSGGWRRRCVSIVPHRPHHHRSYEGDSNFAPPTAAASRRWWAPPRQRPPSRPRVAVGGRRGGAYTARSPTARRGHAHRHRVLQRRGDPTSVPEWCSRVGWERRSAVHRAGSAMTAGATRSSPPTRTRAPQTSPLRRHPPFTSR